MRYFQLRHEYPGSGFVDGDVEFAPELERYYQVGTPLSLDGRKISVRRDKAVRKLKADFFLTTSGAFFASEALATLLRLYESNLQTFASETRYFNGKATEKSYCLVHTPCRLSCFDYHRSEYAGKPFVLQRMERGESPDTIMVKGVKSLKMDEACFGNSAFFFLKNVVLIDPIVSEPLADAMRSQRLKVRLESLG